MLGDPPESLTFSDLQYGARAVAADSWYARCVVDLRSRPVIYIGTELNERTLWQHIELRRRQGVDSEVLPPGSVLVTPELGRARRDTLRTLNVKWVAETAEGFERNVLRELADTAARGMAFLQTYDESFGRAGVPLVSELAGERTTTATEYLMGEEPRWSDIVQGRAAARSNDGVLLRSAQDILEGRKKCAALGVTGTAGAGKSTALMRLALELSNRNVPVLWIDRDSLAPPALIRRRVLEFEERVVLAIDDADTYGGYLVRLIRDLVPTRTGLLFVFAMRSAKIDEVAENLKRTKDVALLEHVVPNLTDDDIDALIATLERHNRLGILKGVGVEARRRAFRDKCGRQLLVAMLEATSGERFEDKIADELGHLGGLQKFVYAVLCIAASQNHYLTRDEVLLAAQGLPADANEALTLLVRRHICVSLPPSYENRPRHRVVAEVVFERLQQEGQLAQPLGALNYALASKVEVGVGGRNRVWQLLKRLINHEFLVKAVDLEEARKIFRELESLLASDYHYWLQRGSLEVECGNLKYAEHFLGQARSLAPEDYRVQTEYGYFLMKKGIEAPTDVRAQAWVEEGMQLLEGVIGTRGEQDFYAYHVLGAQGLAWARRVRTASERRRLLLYCENVVEQGVKRHPFRRDLEQLRLAIQRDVLLTVVPEVEAGESRE